MVHISSPGFAGTRRVMIFIDGAYLRRNMKKMFQHDEINYELLVNELRTFTSYGKLFPELIRAYYYDANFKAEQTDMILDNDDDIELDPVAMDMLAPIYEEKQSIFREQEKYLKQFKNYDYFEVRLGRLKKTKRGLKQKGVDTIIAIDMISKAYENHYDVAVLLSGDDDLLDVVNIVKNTGKRVFGAFFEKTISQELQDSFDKRKILTMEYMKNIQPAYKTRQT